MHGLRRRLVGRLMDGGSLGHAWRGKSGTPLLRLIDWRGSGTSAPGRSLGPLTAQHISRW